MSHPLSMNDIVTKPRLLLCGHTYMIAANREKANALAEFFQVMVCAPDATGWEALGKPITDEEADLRPMHYELLRLKRWPTTRKHTTFVMCGLERVMRDFRPDVVLVENEPWSFLRWQVRWLSWRIAPQARFAEFTWENVRRPGWKGILSDLIYRATALTADRVICGNRAAADLFLDAGLPASQIHIDGQLGISEEDFPLATTTERNEWREKLGWNATDYVIGFCGRLVPEKGIAELAEAIHSLRERFPKLRFAILGHGQMETELLALPDSGNWLRILPPVPHLEVYDFLNKIDLFVLPSKPLLGNKQCWEEQFGHVLIEAITAGALTVGSDSGAIPEVIDDPRLVFPHGSTAAITNLLERILDEPEKYEILRKEQRETCLKRWHHRELARRYAESLDQSGQANDSAIAD